MYEGWFLSVQFRWTPILTYQRRRSELLDWLEANTEPVAFVANDSDEHVGVALVAPDLRISVSRSGMVVESGASGNSVELLEQAIVGTFEVMEPRDVLATRYYATGTTQLDDDCAHAMSAFGKSVGGAGVDPDRFAVKDGSALFDLLSDTMKLQVEWGIVSGEELVTRLAEPDMSRVDGRDSQSSLTRRSLQSRKIPPVAVFTDQRGIWRKVAKVTDVSDVLNLASEAKQTATTVGTNLADFFQHAVEEAK